MSFWPLLLLLLIMCAGLMFLLRFFLSRIMVDGASRLQGLSAEYGQRQDELRQRLEEAEKQYAEQITRAKTQAEQVMKQARHEADTMRSRLLDEARQESERIVQQGIESRDAIRKELEQRMEVRAVERACELIQQVLPGQLRQDVQAHWLDELLQHGLAQLERLKVQDSAGAARIVSAFPLTPEQRTLLRQHLRGALGKDLEITEATDDKLVAGLTITVGSLVLDGSLATKLQQAARHRMQEHGAA